MMTVILLSPFTLLLLQVAVDSNRSQNDTNSNLVQSEKSGTQSQLEWQTFSLSAYQKALQTERIVLIDFYADWNPVTKYRQSVTFKNPDVIQEIQDNNMIAMRGDWTQEDPEIAAFLKSHGFESIPLLVLTSKSTRQKPLLFPGPLSEEGLLKGIDSLK